MFAVYFNSPALRHQPVSYLSVSGAYKPYLYDTAQKAQALCNKLNAFHKALYANHGHSYEVREYKPSK